MAAVAQDVINEAASLLNDNEQVTWNFTTLLPFLQKAHREMQIELLLAGLPVIKQDSAVIIVPAGTTNLATSSLQPPSLIEPEFLMEKPYPVNSLDVFIDMKETMWDVNDIQAQQLGFWWWLNEQILFLGATQANVIRISGLFGLPIPANENDGLGLINAQVYLGPKTAALAVGSIGGVATMQMLNMNAAEMLRKLVQYNTRGMQGSGGVKRIPYRRRRNQGRIL